MSRIARIHAREILDSRGNPTVEAEVFLESGASGRAAVPSGASTGQREALELRDGDRARYLGKGVQKAVQNICLKIAPKIIGLSATDQSEIDQTLIALDGTPNKRVLGANALLGVSLATAKAAADDAATPLHQHINQLCGGIAQTLPTPMMNILNGGAHADNGLAFQEFMMIPAGAKTFSDALRMGAEVFHHLKAILKKNGLTTAVGDEGGFAPAVASHARALELVVEAISAAGFQAGRDVFLALDAAASEFYEAGEYHLKAEGKRLSSEALIDYYESLLDRFPIISIEDGLSENDWAGWKKLTDRLGKRLQLVGDDLFVTDAAQVAKGVRDGVANAVLIKVNQIGTLTETLDAVRCAQQAGYGVIVSHRSGETEDVTLADLAVGCGAGQIKCGSLSRTDRTAKYNQLLRIEETLGPAAHFSGPSVYRQKGVPQNGE